MRLPVVGTALKTLALLCFAWTLQLTTATALDVKCVFSLSLQSTRNAVFMSHDQQVQALIQNGDSIHSVLNDWRLPAGVFARRASGRGKRPHVRDDGNYRPAATRCGPCAMAVLTKAAGYGVWLLVAGLIITLIFRLAGVYIGNLNRGSIW